MTSPMHDVTRWNDDFLTITQGRCRRRRHLTQRFQGSLAPIFLGETQQHGKENDEGNRNGLGAVAQKNRKQRGHQQDCDQDVFKLSEKNAPGRDSVSSLKFVGAVLRQTTGRLSLSQARGAVAAELADYLGRIQPVAVAASYFAACTRMKFMRFQRLLC